MIERPVRRNHFAHHRRRKYTRPIFTLSNNSIGNQPITKSPEASLKRLSISSTNGQQRKRHRLAQLFFPTRSRVKLHRSSSTIKQTPSSLNEQVSRLNQRAFDVRTGIERSISSLQTQRREHLSILNEKTRDLERAAAQFESTSSKHLKQELDKTRRMSYLFKIAISICLILFSLMLGYTIIQLGRQERII